MLKLIDICKQYKTGTLVQNALDHISLSLRDNEFVAVLGPSGSGKTTLLNIIGGLDRYDSGDLVINNVSTRKYKDRDWDSYRNHTIGFVFQSYNLIPHQTILSNVELALTISGIPHSERVARAKKALEDVGLGDQLHKKPNQMSGGQMQRVAIARALVNDPDILLADEPTGALDSQTSLQVMELLKEVARDRLVVMVTHNPELADQYATRIVKLKDGRIVDDTDPYETESSEEQTHRNFGKASMSFRTALSLSFNNLGTKKGRTILTSFAGSIGIIGIALILSFSTGVSNYITDIQRKTMTSYPVTIQAQTIDLSGFLESEGMETRMEGEVSHDMDAVYSDNILYDMASTFTSSLTRNNLKAFKEYLDEGGGGISKYVGESGIVYSYDVKFNVYARDPDGVLVNTDGVILEGTPSSQPSFMGGGTGLSGNTSVGNFEELLPGSGSSLISSALTDNYDLVYGEWPDEYDEVVLVLDPRNELQLTEMYELGILPSEEYNEFLLKLAKGEAVDPEVHRFEYSDIAGTVLYLVPSCDTYEKNSSGVWESVAGDADKIGKIADQALKLRISGIIRPADISDINVALITSPLAYTRALTEYLIDYSEDSEIIKEQKSDPEINVLTGKAFGTGGTSFNTGTALDFLNSMTAGGTYENNLAAFGAVNRDEPSTINIYADTFQAKDGITRCIEEYNEKAGEADKITYTDYVGLLMSSVTRMVNAVTYILIAFVAVSLIVSSIMIGIITYISVLERTREIGILRAIGASKRNISQVFNAETFLIGLFSGLMGIGISFLLLIPINRVVHAYAETDRISAVLPIKGAIILIALSMFLTIIAGFIPSKKAARKDPVAALRSD
ncbi:MAG: ABC transporter ATP-binding protein/permease [Blautia sp.]|nr:ABC transporter ATP-binding protein/permease [Blautia sp.]